MIEASGRLLMKRWIGASANVLAFLEQDLMFLGVLVDKKNPV